MIGKRVAVGFIFIVNFGVFEGFVVKRDVVEDIDFNITLISCAIGEAMCMNGDCIALSKICDGNFDCSDNSDEHACANAECKSKEFKCTNKKCIPMKWTCDGENDCGDDSDEFDCSSRLVTDQSQVINRCGLNKFACANGDCISATFQCDSIVDCADGSDELGCD